jgi:hypothetical protein
MAQEPLNQQIIEINSRLSVLEYLVAQLFTSKYLTDRSTAEHIEEQHRKVRNIYMRQTIPTLDPAQSDLMAERWRLQ